MCAVEVRSAAFDCPACPACGLPAGTIDTPDAHDGELFCLVCTHLWKGTAAELVQASRADAAFRALAKEVQAKFDAGLLVARPARLDAHCAAQEMLVTLERCGR
jgi:hypothetical protein